MNFDPLSSDPFGTQRSFGSPPSAPTPISIPPHSNQQQTVSPQSNGNPFGVYTNTKLTQPKPHPTPISGMVSVPQQANQWSLQQGQVQQQQMGLSPQTQSRMPQQQPVQQLSPPNAVVPTAHQSGYTAAQSGAAAQQPYGQQLVQHSPVQPPQPYGQQLVQQLPAAQLQQYGGQPPGANNTTNTAPPAVVTEDDDDFFGDFSNTSKAHESPNRPPSVFEATQNDDVSYLSRSTNGGLSERQPRNGKSPLEDPKFAPKPPPVHGLQNAQALAQHAPVGASPLPDFDLVTHSGYILARISFRTILIKKWKQIFWVTYGANKVLFFRSSADFEDWVSNPYLSQSQREFLVKLEVDFVEDCLKQGVRGYQVTNQRLKNYNNKMLHQFKLERWMDYGPTIAAAFASSNEREVYNLRTIFVEMMKRVPQNPRPSSSSGQPNSASTYSVDNRNVYGNPQSMNYSTSTDAQNYYSSSASAGGRMNMGPGSVYSSHSQKSHGVMSTGPMERARDPNNEYVGGYKVVSNARY